MRTVHEIKEVPRAPAGGVGRRSARCVERGEAFDVRVLSVESRRGGLVTLARLEAVEMEVEAMSATTPHMHVVHCHSIVVENIGHAHTKVLLSDPTTEDLALRLLKGPPVEIDEVMEIGQQLAFGLGHLHLAKVLYGSDSPAGILKGLDGFWKLGDFSRVARVGGSSSDWREQHRAAQVAPGEGGGSGEDRVLDGAPPEAAAEGWLSPAFDIWLLGRLLARLLLALLLGGVRGERRGAAAAVGIGNAAAEVVHRPPPDLLLEPRRARLWLLLRWLMAAQPESRPDAKSVASLVCALGHTSPEELLEELPPLERVPCLQAVEAAARHLAAARLAAEELGDHAARVVATDEAARARIAGSGPLLGLRALLRDVGEVDDLCRNCGIDPEAAFAPQCVEAKLPSPMPQELDSGSEDGSTTSSSGHGRLGGAGGSGAGSSSSGRSSPTSVCHGGGVDSVLSGRDVLLREKLEGFLSEGQRVL